MSERISQKLSDVSAKRILGFACLFLWTIMMFYSVALYGSAEDPRTTLYQNQTVSLSAFVLGAGLMMIVYRPHTHIAQSKTFAWGSAALTTLGTIVCYFATSTASDGPLLLAFGGIATGLGTGVLLVLWLRLLCNGTMSRTLVEYGTGLAVALAVGLILLFAPSIVSWAIVAIAPLASAACFVSCFSPTRQEKPHYPQTAFSKGTIWLFGKMLVGVALLGFLQGFTDFVSGSASAFTPNETHGAVILLAALLVSCVLVAIGAFSSNPLDMLYRVSMLLLGLGFALMAFTEGSYTFYTAMSFAGYTAFILFVCVASRLVSSSFRTGATRTIALGVGVLYGSEAIGLVAGGATTHFFGNDLPIVALSMTCILLYLVVQLFLLDEISLIHAGIGEMDGASAKPHAQGADAVSAAGDTAAPQAAAVDSPTIFQKTADDLAQRYRLSPRESEVLLLLLQGRTMSRIQETLFISAGTVSTHTRHIYQKVGVANKQELIDLAFADERRTSENADASSPTSHLSQ